MGRHGREQRMTDTERAIWKAQQRMNDTAREVWEARQSVASANREAQGVKGAQQRLRDAEKAHQSAVEVFRSEAIRR